MIKEKCSLAGTVLKPHRKQGNLIIRLFSHDTDGIESGEFLFIDTDGTLIPYCIDEITPNVDSAVIKLGYIDSPDIAQKLTGKDIYLANETLKKLNSIQPDNYKNYIGFAFLDQSSGIRGFVEDYTEDEFNPLFLIKTGENQFLVPAQPEIIIAIDVKRKEIIADLPEGLSEL